MFIQLGNLIINSTAYYIMFYVIGFIFGVNDLKQLDKIGTAGFIYGSIYGFIKPEF
jgi:hypothetical protein